MVCINKHAEYKDNFGLNPKLSALCPFIQGGPAKVRPTYIVADVMVAFECVDKIQWFLANVNCIQQEVVWCKF